MHFGKRVNEPSGHRRFVRDMVMKRVAMVTTLQSRSVDLIDLSKIGAKLRGPDLPTIGQEVLIRLGELEAFGEIIWRQDNHCGIKFDVALTDDVALQRDHGLPTLLDLSPEDLLAADDWCNDFVR